MAATFYVNQLATRLSVQDVAIAGSHAWNPPQGEYVLTEDNAEVVLYLSPGTAKRLAQALNQAVATFEILHGPIPTETDIEALKRIQADHPDFIVRDQDSEQG